MKIAILMSTYNGERFIKEQIGSINSQDILTEGNDIKIYVRDDVSSDNTVKILRNYKEVILEKGNQNLGPGRSFWKLIHKVEDADYYAFCDQDDVWFKNKLSTAISKIKAVDDDNRPVLYMSNVCVTDAELNLLPYRVSSTHCTDYKGSLIYPSAPGCTFVFNHNALLLLKKYEMTESNEFIHDWLAHKIISIFGTIIYDNNPSMYYRQHGNNAIGVRPAKSIFEKLKDLQNVGLGVTASMCAGYIYDAYENEIPENKRKWIYSLSTCRISSKSKFIILFSKFGIGFKKAMFYKILLLFNKL